MRDFLLDKPDTGRRGLLKGLAGGGAGLVWTLAGGVGATSALLGEAEARTTGLSFVQISDSHIGFRKPANPDPLGTLRETLARIKALKTPPAFVLHTGDVTHLGTPDQFDLAQQTFAEIGLPMHFVPGEHDIVDGTDPKPFLARFGHASAKGDGWYSFDAGGAHFIGLVNVVRLGDRGQGTLGADQIAWLKEDVAALPRSTPIVAFAHFPLWPLYPDWGWGTEDGPAALAELARFGSVTVLNGHIHQIQTASLRGAAFHTARSTAYPQPAPGQGAGPGPLALPAGQLRGAIGLTAARLAGRRPLALDDQTLA